MYSPHSRASNDLSLPDTAQKEAGSSSVWVHSSNGQINMEVERGPFCRLLSSLGPSVGFGVDFVGGHAICLMIRVLRFLRQGKGQAGANQCENLNVP